MLSNCSIAIINPIQPPAYNGWPYALLCERLVYDNYVNDDYLDNEEGLYQVILSCFIFRLIQKKFFSFRFTFATFFHACKRNNVIFSFCGHEKNILLPLILRSVLFGQVEETSSTIILMSLIKYLTAKIFFTTFQKFSTIRENFFFMSK